MGVDHKGAAGGEKAPTPPNSGRAAAYAPVGRRVPSGTVPMTTEKPVHGARPKAPPPLPPPPPAPRAPEAAVAPKSEDAPPTERHPRPTPSVRPSAPADPFGADAEAESIAHIFDRLLASDVEASLAVMSENDRVTAPVAVHAAGGLEEVRGLFSQLASHHTRPVRDFLIDLRWAEASRDWVPLCAPAVQSLRRAAEKLELPDLVAGLDEFGQAMAEAAGEPAPLIEGTSRDRILAAHDQLVELLPAAFALDMDRAQRETVIVQSILVQVPEVRKVTLDRLYAAGVHTIAAYADARPEELAQVAGIPERTAALIVQAFRAYREDVHASSQDVTRSKERDRIAQLLGELEALNTAFERASGAWSAEAAEEKKRTRKARTATLMQINVLLARLGEVARLHEVERLPFDRKLEAIRSWLREAQAAAEHPM